VSQCNETFDRIAHELGGFSCRDAPAVIHVRNPLALTNWTLPVLEAMMVFGAVLALWWAVRRIRREGDPTNLVLWFGSVVYLLVTEIPLYFPQVFGIEDQLGVVFDHNVFTVQFLYERLPLYIVALYPAVTTLAWRCIGSFGSARTTAAVDWPMITKCPLAPGSAGPSGSASVSVPPSRPTTTGFDVGAGTIFVPLGRNGR